jgi:ABC-2 type transport system permease protein
MELRRSVKNMFDKKSKKTGADDDTPQKESFFKKRSFKYGSMATAFTALFVVVVVLVNVAVSWVSTRYPLSADLTAKQTYKLSAKSVSFVKTLGTQKITINVLDTKDNFLNYTDISPVVKILEQYPQYNHNITLNFIDYNKNPTFANAYPNETLSERDVIVSAGSRYKHLTLSDIIETSYDSNYSESVTGYTTEQAIDTALLYVTTADLPLLTLTTGHSETDSTALQSVLKKSNYQIETVNLASANASEKSKALVIVDPNADFSSAEIKKIDDYLNNGGKYGRNVFIFLDPQHLSHPNLDNYMTEWGISAGQGVVYDTSNSINSDYFEVLSGSSDSATLGTLKSNAYCDIAICRPLTQIFSEKGSITTTSVLKTQSSSRLWSTATVNSTTASSFQPSNSDKAGPFNAIVKAVKTGAYNNASVTSTMVVSGSTETFNESSLTTSSTLLNSDVLTNMMSKVVGGPTLNINITNKTKDDTTLDISAAKQRVLAVFFIGIIPLGVLIAGLVIWLKRRHL